MMVLVDTPVWSLALRRRREDLSQREQELRSTLEKLVSQGNVALLGAIRQELLSGIREERQFLKLRDTLRAFRDAELRVEDYEEAARLGNVCRGRGVSGSPIDFLICAVSILRRWPVLTVDQDFARYAKHIPVQLMEIG
ncbi:MAG: PIN domain-containing protein [Acidobacteriaceae bacterium]